MTDEILMQRLTSFSGNKPGHWRGIQTTQTDSFSSSQIRLSVKLRFSMVRTVLPVSNSAETRTCFPRQSLRGSEPNEKVTYRCEFN